MFIHRTENIVDIYPFVDSEKEMPSARIAVYNNKVSYQGSDFTEEDAAKLAAGFAEAFKVLRGRTNGN